MKREVKVKFYFSLFIICIGVTFSDYSLSVSADVSRFPSEQLQLGGKEAPFKSAGGLSLCLVPFS